LSSQEPSLIDGLYDVSTALAQLTKFASVYEKLKERTDSCLLELKDIAAEIEQENELLEYNPEEAETVKSRLSAIYSLQQKHKVHSVKELIIIQEKLAKSVQQSENLDEELAQLEKNKEIKFKELIGLGEQLTKARESVFEEIESGITKLLLHLGMPNAVIKIERTEISPKMSGLDNISILFSANKGVAPADIKSVASGGEFSRLMFAIKYLLAGKTAMPTIIFDEIDTGISGEVSLKMADMMKDIAEHHQLLCITHLPQVAGKGHKHFFVYKDDSSERTISQMKELSYDERVNHIAEMIGGKNASSSALENAKELLKSSNSQNHPNL